MLKVLLLSYYFSPQINGGVPRPVSMLRYLPRFGLQLRVITAAPGSTHGDDARVVRTASLGHRRAADSVLVDFLWRSLRFSLKGTGWPDVRDLKWERTTMDAIEELVRQGQVDVLYATFPSYSALRLGYRAAQRFALPLVVEFRDGLTYEPVGKANPLCSHFTRRFEQRLAAQSSLIITIGKELSRYYRATYPGARVETVFNGYDPADFEGIGEISSPPRGTKKIFSFGSFAESRARNVRPLFTALRRCMEDGLLRPGSVEIALVGSLSKTEKRLVKEFGLSEVVKTHPKMDRTAGFAWMKREASHLLFYGVEGSSTVILTKLLEYLHLGIPVLGICKGNEAEAIIRATGVGEVCGFDEESIYQLLKKASQDHVAFQPIEKEIEKFSRLRQAGEIAGLLTKIRGLNSPMREQAEAAVTP